jgi:Exo-beta-D-glucosaminidase Ig-fold domain/Glycosyl hydrolases family 2/Concanavalin A-like lectin/glucanases superfamily/Glycosyl hydrolases family 2, sugar binding domain/Glycosyl hydrolases family 2, TIM barrel domain
MQRQLGILEDFTVSSAFRRFILQNARSSFLIAALIVPLAWSSSVLAQAVPAEDYGPYNAIFLPDGPALTKPLAAPSPLDSRTAALLDRLGLNRESDQRDVLLEGRSPWTLAFWFRSSEPLQGTVLVAGIGDPGAQDARFVAVEDNHLALWLGRGSGAAKLQVAQSALSGAEWHLAVAVGDGEKITLYADGKQAMTTAYSQGDVAGRVEMAPSKLDGLTSRHFGGQIYGLRVYRVALTVADVEAMAAAQPDFALPTYEEGSRHWAVQTSAQAGYSVPQDPSTLPRGKGGIQKPVAKAIQQADLRTELAGGNPWTIQGGWKLAAAPGVQATGEEISKPGFAAKHWLPATVPGTVLTTMIDRGIYPDPDYGLNNLAIPESLSHQDYWYRVEFKTPQQARGQRLTLTLNGVNYAAEVWLNGKKLGCFTGAFLRGKFDVTPVLSASGENALAVRVSPPPHPGIAHEQSIKAGPGENGGLEVIDGPTFSAAEGWDWIPGIRDRNTGIWQDVTLTATGAVEIGDLQVVTTLPKADRSEADIEIEAPLTNTGSESIEGDLTAGFDDIKVTKHVKLAPGETIVRLEPAEYAQLKVQNPRLWWPNGYGEPTLHTLKVSFATAGKQSAHEEIEFGMREVSYETSLFDQTGHLRRVEVLPSRTHDSALPLIDESHAGIREIDDRTPNQTPPIMPDGRPIPPQFLERMRHTWVQSLELGAEDSPSVRPVEGGWPGTDLVIRVNGVRIAARGGNWGMDDSRKRVSVEHLEPYFRLHRDAHVNIIRNWMGQDTEESFYTLADKYGLMVWNDFWDSTQNYNLEAQDPALFLKNARDTILHFRHHPSIVVWCGRNEGVPQPVINEGLATLVRTLDHTRYYTGSSNQVNLRNSGPYQFQPLETYYRINRGFSVELGIPSVPTLEGLESFIPAPDRWPISDTWAYHDWHQSGNGAVAPFMAHMETEFGAPASLEDFERKAQMLDYVGHRAIFEGFAAHLWEPNSGRMIWMTQPAWPSMEWNFLGSDYDTQSSFYGTQKACEPVHAQLNLVDNAVDLINLGEERSFKVETRVVGLDGRVLSDQTNQVEAAANARTPVDKPDLDKLAEGHTVLVALKVSEANGAPVSDNFYWWAKQESTLRELNDLPKVRLAGTATVSTAGGERKATIRLENAGSVPALLVKLTLQDAATGARILPAYYSENYVSLLPGEARTITVAFPAGDAKPAIALRGWNLEKAAIAIQ